MDLSTKPALLAAPAPAPKLRKKLQKVRRPGSSEIPNNKINISHTPPSRTPPPRILPPLAPDLSDSKWTEYLRSSGYLCATLLDVPPGAPPSPPVSPHDNNFSPTPPLIVVPELSYLSPTPPKDDTSRPSTDTLNSVSSDASAASLRRRAKTPVFHIGQLEARARARKLEAANRRAAEIRAAMEAESRLEGTRHASLEGGTGQVAFPHNVAPKETNVRQTKSSDGASSQVDWQKIRIQDSPRRHQASENDKTTSAHIADSYRALIGADDPRMTDSRPETPQRPRSSREEGRETLTIRHKRRSRDLRRESQEFELAASAEDEPAQISPASDGTLVTFDEETIYFKPISPLTPSSAKHETPLASPLPTFGNLRLQIQVDLLAKELAAAVAGGEPPESTGLMVLTMIEAYEALFDRIVRSTELRYDEVMSLQQSIDVFIKALYAAHESLLERAAAGESEYDD